jgi:flagellar motor switch protein FliG
VWSRTLMIFSDQKLLPVVCARARVALAFVILMFATVASTNAFGEGKPAAKPATKGAAPAAAGAGRSTQNKVTGPVLSHALESKARTILQPYVPASEFHVTVNATPGTKTFSGAPYDPNAVSSEAFESMTIEQLVGFSSKIEINILLGDRFSKSKKNIETLLFSAMKLDKNRGDGVTIGKLGISGEPEAWEKQRDEMNRQLETLKRDNEKLAREAQEKALAAAVKEKDSTKEKEEKKPAAPAPEVKQTDWNAVVSTLVKPMLMAFGFLLFGALIIGVALFMIARSFSKSGQALGDAISTVGKAMEALGQASSSAAEAAPEKALSAGADVKALGDGSNRQGGGISLPAESAYAYLAQVRKELVEGLNETTESILLHYLNQMCSLPETSGRAVAALEILGKDVATEMYRRLGPSAQEAVQAFLHGGSYQRPKLELMMDLADELKTKFMAESFSANRGAPSEKVAERVMQLSAEELTQLVMEMNPDILPRFFLYLEGPRIANLLTSIKTLDANKFQACVTGLSKLPEAEKVDKNDAAIFQAMEAVQARSKADAHRPFLRLYEEIVAASGDEVSDEVVKTLSGNPRLEAHFRANVITFQTFFSLTDETRLELMESLSNKDLAALLNGLPDDQKNALNDALPERRRNLLAEELDALAGSEGRAAKYAFRRVKEIVITKIKKMKAEGTLADSLKKSANPAPAAGAKPGEPAKAGAPAAAKKPAAAGAQPAAAKPAAAAAKPADPAGGGPKKPPKAA